MERKLILQISDEKGCYFEICLENRKPANFIDVLKDIMDIPGLAGDFRFGLAKVLPKCSD